MNPPYDITPVIVKLISTISHKLGEVNANYLSRQSPQLRKQNRIKTIHSSLKIEGNTLSTDQITAIVENKRIIGPEKDVREVMNAIKVYDKLKSFKMSSSTSFLSAHKELMTALIPFPGKYRTKGVGIVQGEKIEHLAPPYEHVPHLMKDLFKYVQTSEDIVLIKSCVFHYEMEFIHPFLDGNGRMGRLWQTLILMEEFPVFEYLPFETLISKTQKNYYKALALSDKSGKSTPFIEYMLGVIDSALSQLLDYNQKTLTDLDRLDYFLSQGHQNFTRKDYMNVFKDISSATASRDLKKGIELKLIESSGEKNKTNYQIKST